jgi:hypothetical protein
MVVFSFVVGDMVMLVTGKNSGVMVVFVFVVGDVVMLVNGVDSGAMVVASFVINEVSMLVMSEVRSPCCHIDEARKSMRATKQWVCLLSPVQKMASRTTKQRDFSGP